MGQEEEEGREREGEARSMKSIFLWVSSERKSVISRRQRGLLEDWGMSEMEREEKGGRVGGRNAPLRIEPDCYFRGRDGRACEAVPRIKG